MTIGIDAGALAVRDERLKVGVYQITLHLLEELSRIDTVNEYRLFSFIPLEKKILSRFGKNMRNVVVTPATGWMTWRLPLELILHPVDVFLGLAQVMPPSSAKKIGVIYDLGFFFHPDAYGASLSRLVRQTDALVRRSDRIVTISEASKRDIVDHYGIDPSRVTVNYVGVEKGFTPAGPMYRSKNPYILFVGSLNKAKNLPLALTAFSKFLKIVKIPYDFLLIGGDYWPDQSIDETITRLKLRERVKKIGHVEHEKLAPYYRGALAFLTTSHREGFCMPVAESMACGTPVVAINRGALTEIIGKGGIVVESKTEDDIAGALYRLVSNKDMHESLSRKAIEQAKKFSWISFAHSIHVLINSYAH